MRFKKCLCILASALLFTGCAGNDLKITKNDVLEVARDDANATKSECKNVSVEKGVDYYTVNFDTDTGSYSYKIGFDGLIQERSYGKSASGNTSTEASSETQEQTTEEKTETKKTTKKKKKTTEKSEKTESASTVDANQQQALTAALNNVGLEQSDVTDITCTLSEDQSSYLVTFNNGGTINQVTVDATSFTVLSTITGGE